MTSQRDPGMPTLVGDKLAAYLKASQMPTAATTTASSGRAL